MAIMTMTNNMSAPLIVVSDIHLQGLEDERGGLLLDLIERIDPQQTQYFVLLGDIFDFCLGSHRFFQRKFAKLGERLTQLAESGVQVIFFEGNHEFDLACLRWSRVEFVNQMSYSLNIETSEGTKHIALSHGDLLAPDFKYKIFRSVVKSKLAMTASSLILPGTVLDNYALTHAKLSRKYHRSNEACHPHVLRSMKKWSQKVAADHYIFGHFHVPYAEKNAR